MILMNLRRFNKPINWLVSLHVAVILLSAALLLRQKGAPAPDKEEILVLPVEGIIATERGSLGRGMSVDSIVDSINEARKRDNVEALVLRINSPGGSVGAVQEIYLALLKFRASGKAVVS